jgi:acetamidase/formamidase
MPRSEVVGGDSFHYKWSRSHKPALSIRPGARVRFKVNEVTSWQISKHSKAEDLVSLDNNKLYPLAGPIAIEGAKPGDALVVNIIDVKTADWGWSAIIPGLGLLEEFNRPYLKIWELTNPDYSTFKHGIRVPLRPFCGVYGVAPPEEGLFDVMPPGKHGGNMDIRHLSKGSKLLLPVWVDDALFSVGDLHAAQGDGEVCVTAIECPGEVTLGFDLMRQAKIESPRYLVREENARGTRYYGTTGAAADLMEATKRSVRNMIDFLVAEYALSREEAYVLCSVAADLRIHEIVDKPNWVVGTLIPLAVFGSKRMRKGSSDSMRHGLPP